MHNAFFGYCVRRICILESIGLSPVCAHRCRCGYAALQNEVLVNRIKNAWTEARLVAD